MNICEKCWNYQVSELGCLGRDEPCEYLRLDDEYDLEFEENTIDEEGNEIKLIIRGKERKQ